MHFDWRQDCGVGFQYPIKSEGRTVAELDTAYVSRGSNAEPFFVVFFPQGTKDRDGYPVDEVEIEPGQELYAELLEYAHANLGPDTARAEMAADDMLSDARITAAEEMRHEARRDAALGGAA